MAKLFGQHFVAAHQQVGDFEVTNVDGRLTKNGGNVASYFCTPSGQVLHAVVGPVSADELLYEARWALDAWSRVSESPLDVQKREIATAHRSMLGGNVEWSPQQPWQQQYTGWQPPRQHPNARTPQQPRQQQYPWRQGGSQEDRIHMLLATWPMADVANVYGEVFEHILGEKVSKAAPNLMLADRQLTLAEQSGRPILFVIHKGYDNAAGYKEWLAFVEKARRAKSPWYGLLDHYVVVLLPLKELPALSHRLHQPPFEAPNSGTPLLVVTNCYGEQLAAATGYGSHDSLAHAMAHGSVDALQHRPQTPAKMRAVLRWVNKIDDQLADELRQIIVDAQQDRLAAR